MDAYSLGAPGALGPSGPVGPPGSFGPPLPPPPGPPIPPPVLPAGIGLADQGSNPVEQSQEEFVVVQKLSLPLIVMAIPLMIAVVVVVTVVVTRTIVIILNFALPNLFKKDKNAELNAELEYYDYEQPYEYNETDRNYRRRREVSGSPVLTFDSVSQLTDIVLTSLASEECVQRLLCETGKVGRSYRVIDDITKKISTFVSSNQTSFHIFANENNCERFICGTLPVRK